MRVFILAFSFLLCYRAQALEFGCRLKPSELKTVGTNLVVAAKKSGIPLEESYVVTSAYYGELYPEKNLFKSNFTGTIEGFYRPAIDDYYSVIPIPILGVALARSENVVYICAHVDPDVKKSHFTAYMMRGFGNFITGYNLEVKPLAASLLGISELRKKFLFWLNWFPLFDLGIKTTEGVQRLVANIIGDFTGLGVERITLTSEYVEIASGIYDLEQPRKARLIRKIQIGTPE